ncbi:MULTISPECIES: hypothetical protein [unclassified Citrobacter]|nr:MULTISPECIES: hypothetical protein [unclassified Citrobacter]MDM2996355.1 hypothetical protein [Citrobacter sp. CK195]MDM3129167.1 hypothetical protein [Citrobacter sp. CK205]
MSKNTDHNAATGFAEGAKTHQGKRAFISPNKSALFYLLDLV